MRGETAWAILGESQVNGALRPLLWNMLSHAHNIGSSGSLNYGCLSASMLRACHTFYQCKNTCDAHQHSSSPRISILSSCSDWCPLHLASLADMPGYGSGCGSAAQMVRVLSTTCLAFFSTSAMAKKTEGPNPPGNIHPMGNAFLSYAISHSPIREL